MSYQSLSILLPCHGIEDFPVHFRGADADNLLAAWTVLWHPALIAAAENGPFWRRASEQSDAFGRHIYAVPDVAFEELPPGFESAAELEGSVVLSGGTRESMLARALEGIEHADRIDPDLASDFMALGYCFLQVELLTRQMRYSSTLDEVHFRRQLADGARAVVDGDTAMARSRLASCFSMLACERDHYYSVDAYLIDLTLLAPTTLGAELRDELSRPLPIHLLASGAVIEALGERHPETLARLRDALAAHGGSVVGGEYAEGRWPVQDIESIAAGLRRGLDVYRRVLGCRPTVFGRRRTGLSPLIPQILKSLDFRAALHIALDGGRIPPGSQFKTRWEGADGTTLDAVARSPLDASEPGVFLAVSHRLGESMDVDHVASLCFAHWPGGACRWYDELRRVARHTHALGKFVGLDAYFRDTMMATRVDRFEASRYAIDTLRPVVARGEADPLSRVADYWRNVAARRAAETIGTWIGLLAATELDEPGSGGPLPETGDDERPADSGTLERDLADRSRRLVGMLAAPGPPTGDSNADAGGTVLVNPLSASRRLFLDDPSGPRSVEVPGFGFAFAPKARPIPSAPVSRRAKSARPIANEEDWTLANEFFEARMQRETGGIVGLRAYPARSNLLSQRLGIRLPDPRRPDSRNAQAQAERADERADEPYARMIARSVEIVENGAERGVIESRGVLVDRDGDKAAGFRQRVSVCRGDRVIRLDLEIEPFRAYGADPWSSYAACRFAWGDDTAVVSRSLQETRVRAEPGRFEGPLFVEIDNGTVRVAVLTGGLPFHRWMEGRMLDCLLQVRGESRRRFALGIAVDSPHPITEALGAIMPDGALTVETPRTPAVPSGWLFQIGARNIIATAWRPWIESKRARGFRVRLLETAGRATRATLAAYRPIGAARQIDIEGSVRGEFAVEHGNAVLPIGPNEWIEVEAEFATSTTRSAGA
ncbi:MAG: hypothetical protein FJ297_14205 [Planctomycetes bacterium]|nr:hypothetical protein [Planctomycetota bacterium]